jgi:hypothetical protein
MKLYARMAGGIEAGELRTGPETSARTVNEDLKKFRAELVRKYMDGEKMPIYLAARLKTVSHTMADRWDGSARGFSTPHGFAQRIDGTEDLSILEIFR